MAAWQTFFHVIPRRALTTVASPLVPDLLETTDWWAGTPLPFDYRDRLGAVAPPAFQSPERETWGTEDSNFVEISFDAGRATRIRVRVDVRRPDAKFAAGVITFARAANATLVRADGSVIEPTAGGFGLALRGSVAWSSVYGAKE